jgi:hypothetical protein
MIGEEAPGSHNDGNGNIFLEILCR